jgi:adenine-specific DNA-methyltransferase
MARKRNAPSIKAEAYRHTGEKRKNIPLAKIAAEGNIPKIKKARYYYSPHLSPELRFDPTGDADRILRVCEAAGQYATGPMKAKLEAAIQKNQPWLEWAGKKEQYDRGYFDVDPVALHIHERVSAQAIVRTAMREDAQRDLFADPRLPYQKEVQFYFHDVDWANRLILGDSLQVMSSLARRENLAGKVQMIYIDPPYGIKFSSNFQAVVGKRDVKDKTDDLTREPEMVKAYRDTWSLGIHSYLAYLRDRLIGARELLASTGSIFVQIGDENLHHVREVMDSVFGPQNLCSIIAIVKTAGQASELVANVCDFLLWYAKDRTQVRFHQTFRTKPSIAGESGHYGWITLPWGEMRGMSQDEQSGEKPIPDGTRLYAPTSLTSQGGSASGPFPFTYNGKCYTISERDHWKTNQPGMIRLASAERIHVAANSLRFVRFVDDFPVIAYTNFWEDTATGNFTDPKVFVVQTGTRVIERCILMTTEAGDLVLDPTCGSGTTAFVAELWGRRWITVDTSRVSIAIARQRLLTAKYEYYKFRNELQGVSGGFQLKTVPHITLKSIAQNQNLDPIFVKHEPILDAALSACNKALAQLADSSREKYHQKLLEKQALGGKRAISDADRRRWEFPKKDYKWQHWEVPFDTDPDWPKALQDAVTAYRKAWREKMDEVNACIDANAEQEELVDQPEVVRNIVRVSGPFTVEGVRPEELSLSEEGLFGGGPDGGEIPSDIRDDVQNLRAYLFRMTELIRKDGITFVGNKFRKFARVTALFEEKSGTPIHAAGIWEGTDSSEPDCIAIAFGPQYGPVTAQQVEDIIRGSKRYDELVIAGFSFDGEAAVAIQEAKHPKLKIHMAHIRPDVSPGMDGLLKDTPNSQLFTVFGQPEVKVKKHGKEEYRVELVGVDIFDPLKGEVISTGAEKVAAWFLDSDYDSRCFCITQAFFPDQSAWQKIAKALGSQANEDAFDAFAGTVSLPFKAGKYKRIAVKVIDPRGNEVMAFRKLED